MQEILLQKLEELADSAITEQFLREAWTDKTDAVPKYADALGYNKPREDGKIAKEVRDDDENEADEADVEPSSHGDKSKQTRKKSPGNKNNTPASVSKEKYRSNSSTPKNPLVVIGQGPKPMLDPDEVEEQLGELAFLAPLAATVGRAALATAGRAAAATGRAAATTGRELLKKGTNAALTAAKVQLAKTAVKRGDEALGKAGGEDPKTIRYKIANLGRQGLKKVAPELVNTAKNL